MVKDKNTNQADDEKTKGKVPKEKDPNGNPNALPGGVGDDGKPLPKDDVPSPGGGADDGKGPAPSPTDDGKPSDPSQSLGALLMLLRNLSEIVTRGGIIRMDDTVYGIVTEPTNEFKVKVESTLPLAFETFEVGDQRTPYILYKPLCSSSFNNLDTLVDFMVTTFDLILDKATTIFLEPEKIPCEHGEIYNPQKIGIPYSSMMKLIFDLDTMLDVLHPHCRPQRTNGVYRRTVRAIIDKGMADLVSRFFNIVNTQIFVLRARFINMWTYILDGAIPSKVPPVMNELTRLYPIIDPYHMNRGYREIPLSLQFTYGMVCEMFFPEFSLDPFSPKDLNDATGSSTTRNTIINGFNAISLSSSCNDQLYAYLSSFLVPGFIEMNVVFDGIEQSSPVFLLSLLLCKILLQFSANKRWRNITPESARRIDRNILKKLVELKIIEYNGPMPDWVWLWNNFRVLDPGVFTPAMFASLATQPNGAGWMNEGRENFQALY